VPTWRGADAHALKVIQASSAAFSGETGRPERTMSFLLDVMNMV